MTDPVYVTETAERKPVFDKIGITMVFPILDFDQEDYEFWGSVSEKSEFTFPSFKSPGVALFDRLLESIKERNTELAKATLSEMEPYCIKSYAEQTEVEKWAHMAIQMPGDWGPASRRKATLKRIATQKASGRVLEPMCGFKSYFGKSKRIRDVVALDFCREALERYDHPERTRILYDLNRTGNGERMDFFPDGYFQTIGIFFGVNYLATPVATYSEFRRILSKSGTFFTVGSTTQGYGDLAKRRFDPDDCACDMHAAGFSANVQELKSLKTNGEAGNYFLVKTRK